MLCRLAAGVELELGLATGVELELGLSTVGPFPDEESDKEKRNICYLLNAPTTWIRQVTSATYFC